MSDERWRLMEEAFARIEPKDDAEREKLAKMKERMRASSDDMAAIVARHKEETAVRDAQTEETLKRSQEAQARAEAAREAMLSGLEEQADLIERIAAAHG